MYYRVLRNSQVNELILGKLKLTIISSPSRLQKLCGLSHPIPLHETGSSWGSQLDAVVFNINPHIADQIHCHSHCPLKLSEEPETRERLCHLPCPLVAMLFTNFNKDALRWQKTIFNFINVHPTEESKQLFQSSFKIQPFSMKAQKTLPRFQLETVASLT